MFSEIFYTSLYIATFGFLTYALKMCFKSKCHEVHCGCVKIIRNTEEEDSESSQV